MIRSAYLLAVVMAAAFLLMQQFPHQTERALSWVDAKVEAVTDPLRPGEEAETEVVARTGEDPSPSRPFAPVMEDSSLLASVVAEPDTTSHWDPIPAEPSVVDWPQPTTRDPAWDASAETGMDTEAYPSASVQVDALAALAERMEALAIERMR